MSAGSPRCRLPAAPLGLALAVCLWALAAAWAAAPAQAQPVTAARTDDTRRLARSLARKIAKPWPKRQYGNGRFVDEVGGHSAYGEAVLGYALLAEGIREHDKRMVGTALRALRYATDRYSSFNDRISVFQNMAVGFAYRLAQRRLRGDRRWTEDVRPIMEPFIRRQPLVRLRAGNPNFANHLLVESLVVFTYIRSGLTSSKSNAVVGPDRGHTHSFTRDFIQDGVPRLFARSVRPSGGVNTLLLSDPPDKPLAYQGLSIGLYARAMEMLGDRAGARAELTLRRALEASWRLVAPDGDLSYYGRNHEEAFSLSATAYGARVAQRLRSTSRSQARRYEALARRALIRLRDVHLGGPAGIHIIPALRYSIEKGREAVDHGGPTPYGGLAMMYLNAIADMDAPKNAVGDEVRSDTGGTSMLGRGESLFATQRVGPLWMAVRGDTSLSRPTDIRYDGGLLLAKMRQDDGSWFDLIPTRPRLPIHGNDSAGPLILVTDRGTAVFQADRIRGNGRKGLTALGGYRRLRGRPGVSRSANVVYRPKGCGVQVGFMARRGDRIEYSVFLRDRGTESVEPGKATNGGTTVTTSPDGRVIVGRDYRSATYPDVMRARFRWHVKKKRRIRVKVCEAG